MTTNHASRSPSTADKEIGARIRMHRLSKKISQTDLGDKLGISFQQVQKYEKGINKVGSGRIKEVAEHLGVTTNDLLGILDDSEAASGDFNEVAKFLTQPQGFRLARLMMQLTLEQKSSLAHFIEKMLKE